MYKPNLLYPFICRGHLGCFHVLATVNSATMNIGVHVSFWIIVLSGYMPRSAICSNMDATRDCHTKWSKSERERQIPYYITYMWNPKYDTNEPIYETETESEA